MSALGITVILTFTAAMLWLAVVDPRRSLFAIVFLAPWGMVAVDLGLLVNAYQLAVLALLSVMLLRSLYGVWRPNRIAAVRFLAAFIVFAIFTSLIQIAFLPDVQLNVSSARGPTVRAVTQLLMFVFTISPVFLVAWGIKSGDDIVAIGRTYIVSVMVLAVIGWFQLAMWYGIGVNPLPIAIVNSLLGGVAETTEGYVPFADFAIHRMNSLAGEPRTMGGEAALVMLIVQALAATQTTLARWKLVAIWLFMAATMLGTFSTSAMLLWILGSVLQFPTALVFGISLRISLGRIAAMLAVILVPIAIAVAAIEASGFPIIDVLQSRTIERIDESGAIEDFDLAIIDYLKDHPSSAIAGLGLGNAHLYAMPYLGVDFQWYALGQVFVAKTQYLRLISETGVIGLALFLIWFLALLIEAASAIRNGAARFTAIIPITTATLILFLASGGFVAELYIIAGLLSGVAWVGRRVDAPPLAPRASYTGMAPT
jgi:O-antigen ligase